VTDQPVTDQPVTDQPIPVRTEEGSAAARSRWTAREAALLLGPPLLAFVVGTGLLWVVAARMGFQPWLAHTWGRWDSGQYATIATKGYYTVTCKPRSLPPNHPPGPQLCGNLGWFPLYPWALRALDLAGLSIRQAGVSLSAVFHLLSLVVLWAMVREPGRPSRFLVLVLAAVFPGAVYQHAIFPVSMTTFFTLGFLYLLGSGRWARAGVSGAAAAASYVSGVLLAPVALIASATAGGTRAALRSTVTASLVFAGFVGILAVQYLAVGIWGAYFQSTRKYGVGIQNPIPNFVETVRPAFQWAGGTWTGGAPAATGLLVQATQTVAVAVIVVLVVGATLARVAARERLPLSDWAVLGATLALWAFPHVAGAAASQYRSEALLLPCVVLARRLPVPLQAVLVVMAGAVVWVVAPQFFNYVLR
jgi:hypothetical protein